MVAGVLYITLFGIAFGSVLPLRALVMSRHFGGPLYGRLMGLQQMVLAFALAGLARGVTGTYAVSWVVAATRFAAAIPLMLVSGGKRRA